MATILASYDLTGGLTESDVVTPADNSTVAWKLSGMTAENAGVWLTWKVQVDSEDYHTLKWGDDNKDQAVRLTANGSDHQTMLGMGCTNLKIEVRPDPNMNGDLVLYAI